MGDSRSSAVLGALVALGLIVGLIGGGRYIAQAADIWQQSSRTVTVRGLAEREIPADLALWPLNYTVDADTLGELQKGLERDRERISNFLLAADFNEADISVTTPRITDHARNTYGDRRPELRYSAEATVLLRTSNVAGVRETVARVNELVREGVLLSPTYEYRTEFLFTGLEAIKPEMIAEATADARRAAQQFAQDAGSSVGEIRRATQGYFSINDLDSYTPEVKRVRVVTTVDYALED